MEYGAPIETVEDTHGPSGGVPTVVPGLPPKKGSCSDIAWTSAYPQIIAMQAAAASCHPPLAAEHPPVAEHQPSRQGKLDVTPSGPLRRGGRVAPDSGGGVCIKVATEEPDTMVWGMAKLGLKMPNY